MLALRLFLVAALALSVVLVTGCTPDPGTPTPTDTAPAVSPTPSDPVDADEGLTAEEVADIEDAVSSGDTDALEEYLDDPVNFIIPASECCGPITPAEAIENLGDTATRGPWDFAVPESTIDGYRSSAYYADLFPEEVIVGLAADGTLLAFGLDEGLIVSIYFGEEPTE